MKLPSKVGILVCIGLMALPAATAHDSNDGGAIVFETSGIRCYLYSIHGSFQYYIEFNGFLTTADPDDTVSTGVALEDDATWIPTQEGQSGLQRVAFDHDDDPNTTKIPRDTPVTRAVFTDKCLA